MLSTLNDRVYLRLFLAQVIALIGTGLATIALGLLAFELAGNDAALVLGFVFTIKMVAYVGVTPFASALSESFDRRSLLVALDVARAIVALCLPFVTQLWHVYVLIFLLQSASAAFTPVFQATIPDVLPEEERYTRALSLSRLAYDLENIVSPILAGILLSVASHNALFYGTSLGFFASALLVLTLVLPAAAPSRKPLGFCRRTTRGIRFYLATPRLRALLSLNLAVAAPGAMVLVNSVVLVRGALGLDDNALAWAMFAFGLGSMVSAIALPRFLDSLSDRFVMLLGSTLSMIAVVSLATTVSFVGLRWHTLLFAWFVVGLGYSATLTPAGRLLRRSSGPSERTAIFAAHFALSHVCWLLAYPLAGWLMTRYGAVAALFALATLSAAATVAASRMWSRGDPQRLEHTHDNLPLEHPHLRGVRTHSHALIIDEDHPKWDSYFPPHHYAP